MKRGLSMMLSMQAGMSKQLVVSLLAQKHCEQQSSPLNRSLLPHTHRMQAVVFARRNIIIIKQTTLADFLTGTDCQKKELIATRNLC